MLIRPDYVIQFPHASQAPSTRGCLLALTNVQDMITHELRAAQARLGNETDARDYGSG